MPLSHATPNIMKGPGYLLATLLATPNPTNTVAGGVFTDEWDVAWVRLGATSEGSSFSFGSTVEGIVVAEFANPIAYETTQQEGTWSFAMADYTASKLKLAYNGGVGAVAPTSGTGATALYTVEPPQLGNEVRIKLGWESQDHTVRRIAYQTIQGGASETAHGKAPALGLIPVTFNLEQPAVGAPVSTYFAGASRA